MPELPEVETVVRALRKLVVGKKIASTKIFVNKLIKEPATIKGFKTKIKNQTIYEIERIGKYIIFILDEYVLLSHLRMEGKYFFFEDQKNISVNNKHFMATIIFTDKSLLVYDDTRKFGTFHLQNIKKYKDLNPINKIGPEPFEKTCTSKYLKEKLSKKSIAIKTALLDQTIISGLGNIYVNEVLHLSKVNPLIPSKKVSESKIELLLNYSKKVLKKAIKLGGSSISTYTSSLAVNGKFQNHLLVHTKKGEKCTQCKKAFISKIKVNGRGTYYCKVCQE